MGGGGCPDKVLFSTDSVACLSYSEILCLCQGHPEPIAMEMELWQNPSKAFCRLWVF